MARAAAVETGRARAPVRPRIARPEVLPGASAERCRSFRYVLLKRLVDVPLATLALVLFGPLMLVLAALVRLGSPGPVLFRQRRLGRGGRTFDCLKFRSMYCNAEDLLGQDPAVRARYVANGYKLPASEDPRITAIGRFLRSTSLDELPQLFNVLRGDMSLVGPRPIVPAELAEYGAAAPEFLAAIPGITGRWQVSGRSNLVYPERAAIELDYITDWSVREDLRILVRTLPVVLSRVGAH